MGDAGASPEKRKVTPGKAIGCGCLGVVGLFIVVMVIASFADGSMTKDDGGDAAAPAAAGSSSTDAKAQVDTLWSDLKILMERCDAPAKEAAGVMESAGVGGASIVDAYAAANRADAECKQVWLDMGQLQAPKATKGESRAAFKKAIDTCSMAYFSKQQGLEQLKQILDEGAKPSSVVELQERATRTQAGQMACLLNYREAGQTVGWEMPELAALSSGKSDAADPK